jgi:photosystem II stability/assembly factor-like uncharacterized protein
MKRTTLALAMMMAPCLLAHEAAAGWTRQQNLYAEDQAYSGIAAGSMLNAYAAGVMDDGTGNSKGVILSTTDGGVNWAMSTPDSGMLAMYFSAWSPLAEKCYVGGLSKVFVTVDGGMSWTMSQHADMRPLKPILGIGGFGENFVVATAGSEIFVSIDGAATWNVVTSPLGDVGLSTVYFVDASTGWIIGGGADYDTDWNLTGYSDGSILQTTDGGLTWTPLRQGEARGFGVPSFINPSEGWITSNSMTGPLLEVTIDGGRSWQPMTLPPFTGGTLDSLSQVTFFDRCEGFLLGADEQNKITALFYTTDAGASWVQQGTEFAKVVYPPEFPFPFPVYSLLFAMDFATRRFGWIVGTYDFIGQYTADGEGPNCGTGPGPDGSADAGTDGGPGTGEGSGCGCTVVM